MSGILIGIIVIGTALLALYWIFYGQRKYNDMLIPKRKTELKAVLFDLDGVILDSFEAWYSVFNHARKDFGLKEISRGNEDEGISKIISATKLNPSNLPLGLVIIAS